MNKIIGLGLAGIVANVSIVSCVSAAYAQATPTLIRQGFGLLNQGRIQDAIAIFEQAVQRYPDSLEAKLGLAISYRRQGLIPQAWSAYQGVLAQDPNNQLALKAVGLLGTYRSEWQVRGIEALTTLLNINPNDNEARGIRALLYGYQQRFIEAISDYQIVLQANPTPEIILGAAETYTNAGNPQQGLDLFNRYLATGGKPITGFTAISYARALRETGNPGGAIQVLENQLRISPQLDDLGIQTRAALSQAYLANRQVNEALNVLAPLQGIPAAILPLARSLNTIRSQSNNPALTPQIASLYRQALSQIPNPDAKLLREVADVLSGIPSERQTALQIYQQLIQIEPNNRPLIVKVLALQSQLGLISKAELRSRLFAAVQPLPADPNERQQLAQSLAGIDPPGPEFIAVYFGLLQSGANVPFLNFRIAQLLIENGDLGGARQALAAYAATPEGARDLSPQLLAAEIERREGNLEGSAYRYQALIASNPPDRDIIIGALRGLATVRVQQNRPIDALVIFDQLIARNPQDLTLQLARTSLAYEAKVISELQAEGILNYWFQSQPPNNAPPELFALVGTLPANARREGIYNYLLQIDPNNIPIQIRAIQVIAQRSPEQARVRVAELVARDPTNIRSYFLQGELGQAIKDFDLASQAYNIILAAQPSNRDALSALAGVRFQQKRFNDAADLYYQSLAINPNDKDIRRTLIDLDRARDFQMKAFTEIEGMQIEQIQNGGVASSDLSRRRQEIQEDFLQRRGFQPPWEQY